MSSHVSPSATPLTVRPARHDDAATIVDFNLAMARETESLELDAAVLGRGVERALADPALGRYFMAEIAGEPAGCLMLTREWSDWRNGELWWIQSVYVPAGMRRRGVFRALYEHVRATAREAGAVGLRLYVEQDNAAAQQTYQRLGMRLTGYRVMEEML